MMLYADIAVHRGAPQTFTYHVPPELEPHIQAGQLVHVPFRTGHEAGILIRTSDEEPSFATKPILEILDYRPILTDVQMHLAEWLAEHTLTPVGHCLWLLLPPGFAPRPDWRYTLINPRPHAETDQELHLVSLLTRRGALTGQQLSASIGNKNWSKAMQKLVLRGDVQREPTLAPPIAKPKTVRRLSLSISPESIQTEVLRMGKDTSTSLLIETLARQPQRDMPLADLLTETGVKKTKVRELVQEGYVSLEADDRVVLRLSEAAVEAKMLDWRGVRPYLDILLDLVAHGGEVDVRGLYAQSRTSITHINKLQEMGLVTLGESEVWRNSLAQKTYLPTLPPSLTSEQAVIVERLQTHLIARYQRQPTVDKDVFLLHGVTGSGKTEIYLRAIEQVLQQGRSAVVMVPEIALTAQMVQRLVSRFGDKVALLHSSLSTGERYDTWRRAREGLIRVVIGARSALFIPLVDVGLVILDEEHDDSYKQSPPVLPPYYHARDVAIKYMELNCGTVILGSATPDLTSYFQAQQGNYTLLELPNRVLAHRQQLAAMAEAYHLTETRYAPLTEVTASLALPPVQIVDMRQELRVGNTSVFSRALQVALHEVLSLKHQALLFLNRRGTATYVFCRDCGYIANCHRCDTPLTYHETKSKLICHGCGHQEDNPRTCPACKSERIKYFGRGTHQIETLLNTEFAGARILRWDQDTASNHEEHEKIFQAFLNHEADILVGTQMIAKGLDLPKVTLVGILSGDTGLGLPDYRANENTFQLLTQVAGRAGRSPLGGRVILQTYHPDHYAIQAAAQHDYHIFYERELAYRRELRWTPFTRLARLLFQDELEDRIKAEAQRVAQLLTQRIETGEFTASSFIGPVPCFFTKHDLKYRWQIILRSPAPVPLLKGLEVGQYCTIDIDPVDIL